VCERLYDSLWEAAVPELFLFSDAFSGDFKIQLVFSKIQVNHYCICKGVKIPYGAAIFREI
jgi:hypothetical protein